MIDSLEEIRKKMTDAPNSVKDFASSTQGVALFYNQADAYYMSPGIPWWGLPTKFWEVGCKEGEGV